MDKHVVHTPSLPLFFFFFFPVFSQEGNPKLLYLSPGGISSISHDKTQVLTDKEREKLSKAN